MHFNENISRYFSDFRKIIVVRNPYTRIVSCYVNIFVQNHSTNILRDTFESLEPYLRENLERETFFIDSKYVGISFNEFLDFVSRKLDLNDHWNVQNKITSFKYDKVVHMENLDAELSSAFDDLGINNNYTMVKHNVTSYNNDYVPMNMSDMKSIDIIANCSDNVHIANFINDDNREKIYKIYYDDFVLGDYSKL